MRIVKVKYAQTSDKLTTWAKQNENVVYVRYLVDNKMKMMKSFFARRKGGKERTVQ